MRDTINDCFVDIVGEKPTKEQIDTIVESLPLNITIIATQWGPNDTEFGDKLYVWLKDNMENFTTNQIKG